MPSPSSQGFLRSFVYPALRPVYYPARYYYRLLRVRSAGLNVTAPRGISMDCSHEEMARRLRETTSPRVGWRKLDLAAGALRRNLDGYFERHRSVMLDALEHMYDPILSLTQCARLLKPGALMVIKSASAA